MGRFLSSNVLVLYEYEYIGGLPDAVKPGRKDAIQPGFGGAAANHIRGSGQEDD